MTSNDLYMPWLVGSVSLLYVGFLFVIASRGQRWIKPQWQPYVYSLTLAIFCTTWAFYGTIREAATRGWLLAPTYLGAILLITLGWRLFDRIIKLARQENSTTISDFIAARYGHSRGIGMAVALLCLLGIVPYIALQLKAVSGSFQLITDTSTGQHNWLGDPTFYIAVIMALFSILFGTRTVDSSESHQGMMLAIAFESIVKLLALFAVGLFAVYGIYDGFGDLLKDAMNNQDIATVLTEYSDPSVYLTHALLGAIAIIALPRHFHVTVVEYRSDKDIHTARWMFPLYLLMINLFVLPLGLVALLNDSIIDTFNFITLRIPMEFDQPWLALLAYLGGLSAGTSMVIISSITLATMMCNELILPLLLKLGWQQDDEGIKNRVLTIRRIAIVLVLGLGFLYYRLLSQFHSLAEIGVLSFVAVAQFAPAMLIGLIWHGANRNGALWGIGVGFGIWIYTLFLPVLTDTGWISADLMNGLWGLDFLRPHALLGLEGLNPTVHGTFWSLILNSLALVIGSLYHKPAFSDIEQAQRFVIRHEDSYRPHSRQYAARIDDLRALLLRFLTPAKVAAFFEHQSNPLTGRLIRHGQVDDAMLQSADRLLRSVLGRKGSDLLLRNFLQGHESQYSQLNTLMEEVSEVVLFNRDLLNAVLHSLNQGITVADSNQNLVAWNARFADLYQIPAGYLYVGQSSKKVIEFIANSGGYGDGDRNILVNRRLQEIIKRQPLHYVRETSDGRYIELNGIPIGADLYVTVYTDITSHRLIESQLRSANEVLEDRVEERTQKLLQLNRDLQKANTNKTRFLAAAGHDLVQPMNSASLFSASIINKLEKQAAGYPDVVNPVLDVARHLDQSLNSAESLLSELLEISKLDAELIKPNIRELPLSELLDSLIREFRPLVEKKSLENRQASEGALTLSSVSSRLQIKTDPVLLRRILQNLLANALRYTHSGKILIGVRRRNKHAEIQVWDTGIGIKPDQHLLIFDEFHRVSESAHSGSTNQTSEKGLGLGLSIVHRLGTLLEHPISLQSEPGKGSCFSVTVPICDPSLDQSKDGPKTKTLDSEGLVLCVDNEQQIIDGMYTLLTDWGYQVITALDLEQARSELAGAIPDLAVVDYHLDNQKTGTQLLTELQKDWPQPVPAIVVTADYTESVKQEVEALGCLMLRKPIKAMALRAAINRVLSTRS